MTDRFHSLTVALKADLTEEQAKQLVQAIMLLQGVLAVTARPVSPDTWFIQERVRCELADRLWEVLRPKKVGG
jgi:hypothetical protein